MSDKIIIGKNGNEHGIWVAKPGQGVEDGGPYLMSSVADMLKIHTQGSRKSTGLRQSEGLWRHEVEVVFPALPFIPLAFMGFKTSDAEPLSSLLTTIGLRLISTLETRGCLQMSCRHLELPMTGYYSKVGIIAMSAISTTRCF
jgi:hypothetical protein